MNRAEFISLAGLRPDGRRPNEIRRIRCKLGTLNGVDGSAYLEMGQTKVIAIVKGPREVAKRSDQMSDRVIINCACNLAPFAGADYRRRRQGDRRIQEIASSIKAVFEGAILLDLYAKSQIDIHLHIIQQDGGNLPAAINATCLALIDAGVAMKDMVSSCSSGYIDGQTVMDLNSSEQKSGGVYAPVAVLPRNSQILLAKMEARLPFETFQEVLAVALDACEKVHSILEEAVKEHHLSLITSQIE